jgi:branched-chain amino acid transport system permease protein
MKAVGLSEFSDVFTFVLLIIVLMFRPTGLFGEKMAEKV